MAALRNQAAIDHLLEKPEGFSEWIATIAFYKALHVVEAVFFAHGPVPHGHSHEDRDRALKVTPEYSEIYKHYRPLWAASMVARYLYEPGSGLEHPVFSTYLSPEKVKSELLGHRLHRLQVSAKKFLSPRLRDRLG